MHIIRQKLVAQSPTALKRILLATLLLVAGLPSSAITFSADSTDLDMSEFKKELAEYYKKVFTVNGIRYHILENGKEVEVIY